MDIDSPDLGSGLNLAITPCKHCGVPLINKNGSDNWELLKPSDISGLPKDLQGHIAEAIMGKEALEMMKEKLDAAINTVTPFDRARIFLPVGVCNSEGCILLMSPNEWGAFAVLSGMKDRPQMRDAMHHIASKNYEQNIEMQ